MRTLVAGAWCVLLASAPADSWAQAKPAAQDDTAKQEETCTDVQVGSAQSYACLNAQLKNLANSTQRPSSMDAPVSATSPSNVVGTFNEDATRNRLGTNFGKSAVPSRPAQNYQPQLVSPR
jgi:hypothetical protein